MKNSKNGYRRKLEGAIIGRFAGCALGAPVEMMEIGKLRSFCEKTNQPFPPVYYFRVAPDPDSVRYKYGKGRDFTSKDMRYLSTDDDIAYTILSLMMLEDKLDKLSVSDVADYWLKYLPKECTFTSERTTLTNLENGVAPHEAAIPNNNELDYIGAAIRVDGYGYVFPGNPKKAVELAYQDAYLSHRGDGLYSALYFAALISLAFKSENIEDSIVEALQYIPSDSNFHKQITWAISMKNFVTDYEVANRLVTERFPGMSWAHSINNACLTIWGIYLGQNDYSKGITQTVAMGYDNDCTAATVGSVLGAYLGIDKIDKKWYEKWNNTILSYFHGIESFKINDIVNRFYDVYFELNKK